MINDTLRLTFGVELELVLVFHEKRLQQILSQDPKRAEATIIKDLEQRERDALGEIAAYGWVGTLSRYYNSWALENAGTHQYAKTLKDEDIQSKTLKGKDIRRYGIEPLEIAREVLLPIRPNIRIHEGRAKPDDVHIFEDWHITNDYSLIGIDKKQMINDLPDRIPNLEVAEKWDSYGLEIVSRVLNDVEAAEAEFETILSALKGDSLSLHGVTSNEHCAVHVHVGRENLGFTLPTLQHLAYLLVVYEHEIEKIHPATQREGSSSADTDTRSNRDSFMVTRYEIQMVLRNGVYERREVQSVPYDTLADVRRRIFEAEGSTLEGLIKLISPAKGYVVNFTYLNTPGRPKTIEFRAHAGCLDTEEIRYWVMFVMGLVRLANHYAQTGGSCPVTEWNNHISFWDLLEDMKFPPSGVEHLKAKAAYNVEWPPKPRLIPEDYTPPASDDSHRAGDNSLGNDQLGKHTPENNSRDNDNQSGAGNGEGPSGQYGTSTQDQSGAPENPPRKGKGTGYHKDSSLEGVREFEAIIQKSYGKIFTPTTGLLCGARALATSLEAVRREAGHTQSPTDQELLSIINGDKHNTLKTARKESMLAGMCSQGAVSEEARKELEDLLDEEFDATNNLTATQLAFALEVVNQLQGQNYRLGICEEREGKHQVYINASDESGGVGPVIWVHNDRYEQVEKEARLKEGEERSESPEPISHWSGIAPGGSPIIETPEDEVLDFANSSINTGSIIGRSPEHGATGSEKRKRDDEDEGETEPSKKIQR